MSDQVQEFCYVGIKPCGCATYAVYDDPDPEWRKETARHLSRMIKQGMTIKRVTVEEVRSTLKRCPHKQQSA